MIRCFGKSLKYVVAVLVVLVLAGAIFGPGRVGELLRYVQSTAKENIDGMIPDEVKLLSDMEKLREEYPRRIAEMQSMIDDLDQQLKKIQKDHKLAIEVLALCEEDLGQLKPQLETATSDDSSSALPVTAIEFRGAAFSYSQALDRSRKILNIKEMYHNRAEASTESVGLLQSERDRLKAELMELRQEYDQFLAEYRSMAREIDLIRHNQKLIEIAGRRENLDRLDASGWIRSLDAIKRAIDQRKTEQRERLRSYRLGNRVEEYETRARLREL